MTVWAKTWHVHTQTEIHFIAPAYSPEVEYWPFVGTCTCHSYSELNYLCLLSSLLKLLPWPSPPLNPSHPLRCICCPNINKFHETSSKTGKNQPLSTCQVNCTKANRLLYSVYVSNTKARLVFNWILKWYFSKYW